MTVANRTAKRATNAVGAAAIATMAAGIARMSMTPSSPPKSSKIILPNLCRLPLDFRPSDQIG